MRSQAFVFLRKDGAPLPVGFMGHVGWAFQLADGSYYCGSTENSTGNLFVKPGDDNGWWGQVAPGMVELIGLFRDLDYDCYKLVTVRSSNPVVAREVADGTRNRGYIGLTNNCLDHVFDILTAYGESGLPFRFQYPSPRSWFAMLNGELQNLKDSTELKRTDMWFGEDGARGSSSKIETEPVGGTPDGKLTKTGVAGTFAEFGVAMVRSMFTEEYVKRMLVNAVPKRIHKDLEFVIPSTEMVLKPIPVDAELTVGQLALSNPDDVCSMTFIANLDIKLTVMVLKAVYKAELQIPLRLVVTAEAPAILQISLPVKQIKRKEIAYKADIHLPFIEMVEAAALAGLFWTPVGEVIAAAAVFLHLSKEKIAELVADFVKDNILNALNTEIGKNPSDRRIDLTREVLMQGASRETPVAPTTDLKSRAPLVAPDMEFRAVLQGMTPQCFDVYASDKEVVSFLIESRIADEAETISSLASVEAVVDVFDRNGKKVGESPLSLAMHRAVSALEENGEFTAPAAGRYRCRIARKKNGPDTLEMTIRQRRTPAAHAGQGNICFDKFGENFIATAIVRELIEDKLVAQLAGSTIAPVSLPEKDPVCRIEPSVELENVLTKSGEGTKGREIVMRALLKLTLEITAKENVWTALADVRFDFVIRTTSSPAAIIIAPQPVPDDGVFFDEKNIKHIKGDLSLDWLLKLGLPMFGAGIIAEKINEQLLKAGETKVIMADEIEKKLQADEEAKVHPKESSPPTMMPFLVEDHEIVAKKVMFWPLTLETGKSYLFEAETKHSRDANAGDGQFALYVCNERGAVVGAAAMYNDIGGREFTSLTIHPVWGTAFKVRAFATANCNMTIEIKRKRK